MDGTINLGMELIPGMEGFFDRLKEAGRSYYLVTNNSSKDHEHYVKKMNSMGVPVTKNILSVSTVLNYLSSSVDPFRKKVTPFSCKQTIY